eukprot:scaffold746_cov293-Chaetoceros_neogracile.AAC.24
MSENITNSSIMSEEIVHNIDSFYFTKAGIIIPMVTGSISFLSSMIVISIVLRSMSGIKTIYHRIILGLSSADCLTSLAIALTTIPMPKDVIYPFEMPSYGNIATCEAQGLVYMMGNAFVFCMNGILNIYYLCTLRYNMTEKTFRCYLEIPLFVAAFAISITIPSTTLLKQELLNPSPSYPFCVANAYPLDCTKANNPECRGGGMRGSLAPLFYCTITLFFFTLVITMTLIVHSFYRNARSLRKALKDKPSQEVDAKYEALIRAQETSSIIGRQALMYIAAFFITWIFGFTKFVWEATNDVTEVLSVLTVIFQPLQGFFNLVIFVYHKVQTLRRADDDLTVAEALEIVFLFPSRMEDRATVSNLNMVIDQFVVDQQLIFENKRTAAMNMYDRRVDLEDSVVVGRGDFDDSDVATMSGSRGVVEAEASSDNISPLELVAGGVLSSKPVSSSQRSNHSGVSYAASSATSIFITGFKGPSAAATQSRIYNEGTNNVTTA